MGAWHADVWRHLPQGTADSWKQHEAHELREEAAAIATGPLLGRSTPPGPTADPPSTRTLAQVLEDAVTGDEALLQGKGRQGNNHPYKTTGALAIAPYQHD